MVTAVDDLRATLANVPDPEIPVLTIEDLGILRGVDVADDGHVVITLTPTYSGCPAIDPIREDVERAARDRGYGDVEVRMALAPAWTTDWMSDEGRRKLLEYGIAPPERHAAGCVLLSRPPRCPQCGSDDTREVSRFGATPCQAQHVCNACREPFDRFKAI
ncbi:MAG: ring,2-phenylacetyl-CoA epoxidase subunit PaaD [Solirubrobacteraceae bacterium]|nr:ring,2-phenylacetyl-CoA epoxidase subunit PaaD [Solirubrobacteraceae bacterium]